MRVLILIMTVGLLHAYADVRSQTVSLRVNNKPLHEVLAAIERQTGYVAFTNKALLAKASRVSLNIQHQPLSEALNAIFAGQPLTYELGDKTIVIKEAARTVADAPEAGARVPRVPNENLILAFPEVRGKIVDSLGQPLSGASVRVLDAQGQRTSLQTQTDRNGEFVLRNVPDDALLEISFIGYVGQRIMVTANVGVIVLAALSSTLDEVEINKGYYTTTRTLNTGNVSVVIAKDIERQPISDLLASLQGRVAGLFIQQTSGVVGREFRVRLRGQNSIENGNDPLFIVDGMPFNSTPPNINATRSPAGGYASPFSFINPNDIESISILKDADATAIYGSRGANGVIIITTKSAKEGATNVSVNFYGGSSHVDQRVKYMNTSEYLAMRRQAFKNDNALPGNSDYDLNGTWDTTRYTNWQDILIGNTAKVYDASISISGGNMTTNYRASLNHRNEGLVYPGQFNTNRTSGQFNLNHQSTNDRLRFSLSSILTTGNNRLPTSGITTGIDQAFTLAPNAPEIYKDDGSLNWENSTWTNPLAIFNAKSNENTINLINNANLKLNLFEGLEVSTNVSYGLTDYQHVNLIPKISMDEASNPFSIHTSITNRRTNFLLEPQISYSLKLFGGSFNILAGSTYQNSDEHTLGMDGVGFSSDALLENIAAASDVTIFIRSFTKYRYSALYSRLGYSLNDKYIVNLTARRDGSSRFGPGRRFGNFGSIGLGWVFSNEKLFKEKNDWLTFGKLRASYGVTGNDQLGDYKYLDTYSSTGRTYQGLNGLYPTQLTNPFFGWESVHKMELALELGFMENKITTNISIYRNQTKNQLVQYALPSTTGFTSVRANLPATIENKGLEVELTSLNVKSKNFSWSTSGNITFPRNKLVSFQNIEASSYATKYIVGEPLNLAFGYQFLGTDKSNGLYQFNDFNQDGALTSTFDYIPKFVGQSFFGGIQNNVTYKGFELDFLIQYTKQNGFQYLINSAPGFFNLGYGNELVINDLNIPMQDLSQSNQDVLGQSFNFKTSDGSIRDASFARLKNVSISWKFPSKHILKKVNVLSLYVQGQNLYTISKYSGFNPETPSVGISLSPLRTLTVGLKAIL